MRRAGFGLVDALVGMVLIGTVCTAALAAVSSGYTATGRARTEMLLVELGQTKLEELRALPTSELLLLAQDPTVLRTFEEPFERAFWRLSTAFDAEVPDLIHMTITIESESADRQLHASVFYPTDELGGL